MQLAVLSRRFFLIYLPLSIFCCAQGATDSAVPDRKPLLGAELYSLARRVSVQILIKDPKRGFVPAGTGVWVGDDGIVATCFHVVKDSEGSVAVGVQYEDRVDLSKSEINLGEMASFKASLVASDKDLDIAILRAEPNPLKRVNPSPGKLQVHTAVAELERRLPQPGSTAAFWGYTRGAPILFERRTVVAGIGDLPEDEDHHANLGPFSRLRIFISAHSNLGDSGGPVLDEFGGLIGLVQGSLPVPLLDDTTGRPIVYLTPARDRNGNFVRGTDGQPKIEATDLYLSSGIAIVIPADFIDLVRKRDNKH